MNKKTKIIIGIILLVIIFFIGRSLLFKEEKEYETITVKKQSVSSEIIETGSINTSQKTGLSLQSSGQLDNIFIEEGDEVERGVILANTDNRELLIQLEESKASLDVAQAQLDKLQAGPTEEKIAVAESKVTQAQTAYNNAQESLNNIQEVAEDSLSNAYEDAVQTLENPLLTVNEVFNFVADLQDSYFTGSNIQSYRMRNNEEQIERAQDSIDESIKLIQNNSSRDNIDEVLKTTVDDIKNIKESLQSVYSLCYNPPYDDDVTASDKNTLDLKRSDINSALNNIIGAQQNIRSVRLSNQSSLSEAQSLVESTDDSLDSAKKDLELLVAEPQTEEVALYEAKVRQAQSQKRLLEERISNTRIIAPTACRIINIKKKVGESVTAGEAIIDILPNNQSQIIVDVYEEEISAINIGDKADIEVIALPNQNFSGEVIKISPGGKLEGGVVYYEVTIVLEKNSSKLKPEMTADVAIKTEVKENVLAVPEQVIEEDEAGNYFVWVFQSGEVKKRIIQTGLKGEDFVEITTGLEEGEKVVTNNWQ